MHTQGVEGRVGVLAPLHPHALSCSRAAVHGAEGLGWAPAVGPGADWYLAIGRGGFLPAKMLAGLGEAFEGALPNALHNKTIYIYMCIYQFCSSL